MPAPIATLLVRLDADTRAAVQGIKSVNDITDDMADELLKAEAAAKKQARAADILGLKTNNLSKATGAANYALLNTSRVAQDASFGFIGVANNIDPLVNSFVSLRTQAAAAGTTVTQSLLSSLAGPGGLLLAVGALTFAMQSFGDEIGNFITGADDASKAIDDFNEALSESITLGGEDVKILGVSPEDLPLLAKSVDGVLSSIERVRDVLQAERDAQAAVGVAGAPLGLGGGVIAGAGASEALSRAAEQAQFESEITQGVKDRLEELSDELTLRKLIAEETEKLREEQDRLTKFDPTGQRYLKWLRSLGQGGPRTPGPEVNIPRAPTLRLDDLSGLPGQIVPDTPRPEINELLFDFGEQIHYLTTDLERLSTGSKIQINETDSLSTQIQAANDLLSNEFSNALGEAVASVLFFGDSVSQAASNFGRRAGGFALTGALRFGAIAGLTAISGGSFAALPALAASVGLGSLNLGIQNENENNNNPVIRP